MDEELPGYASPGVPPGDAVAAALTRLRQAAEEILNARLWAASDAQSRDRVEQGDAVLSTVSAAYLTLIADLDSRDDAVAGARPGRGAAAFLTERCRKSGPRANADVKAARMLRDAAELAARTAAAGHDTAVPETGPTDPVGPPDPDELPDSDELDDLPGVERNDLTGLPRLGLAFRAGQISRDHVDAAVRAVGQIAKRLLDEPDPDTGRNGWERADDLLTQHARTFDPQTSEHLARELRDRLDPDGTRAFDPDGHLRRRLSLTHHRDGMTSLRGEFDPAGAADLCKAIEHYAKPLDTHTLADEHGDTLPIPDLRTQGQRYADALATNCRRALADPHAGVRGGEPAHITVHTTVDELSAAAMPRDSAYRLSARQRAASGGYCPQTGSIGPELLARFACDAIIETVVHSEGGAVLDLGRSSREHNAAQRRAVIARDRGCICCGAPPERCQIHHVQWWSDDGRTDLGNLALVCGACHTKIHLGIWAVRMRDGAPWVRPPTWADPHQRWRRPRPRREAGARQQARQLALGLLDGRGLQPLAADDPAPVPRHE